MPRTATPKISKRQWERHRDIITNLYMFKTLDEVRSEMKRAYGFDANKRQYVYRFSEWKIKKYGKEDPSSETEHDLNGTSPMMDPFEPDHDADNMLSQVTRAQTLAADPAHEAIQQPLGRRHPQSRPCDGFILAHVEMQKLMVDALLVLPRNVDSFSAYKKLHDYLPPSQYGTRSYRSIVDACILSAQPGHCEDACNILNEAANILRQDASEDLRLRLQFDALGVTIEGGLARTCEIVDSFLKGSCVKSDLGIFVLLSCFEKRHGLSGGGLADPKSPLFSIGTTSSLYAGILQNDQDACKTFQEAIKWCHQASSSLAEAMPDINVGCSNETEQLQISMAKLSCLLFAKLLSEPYGDQPQWAQDVEEHLGISSITLVTALVRMSWADRKVWSWLLTFIQGSNNGLHIPEGIDQGTIWAMFLDALVQSYEVAFMSHFLSYTLMGSLEYPTQTRYGDEFVAQLDTSVRRFISNTIPGLSETASDFELPYSGKDGPVTPDTSAHVFQDTYCPGIAFADENLGLCSEDFAHADPFEGMKNGSHHQDFSDADMTVDVQLALPHTSFF